MSVVSKGVAYYTYVRARSWIPVLSRPLRSVRGVLYRPATRIHRSANTAMARILAERMLPGSRPRCLQPLRRRSIDYRLSVSIPVLTAPMLASTRCLLSPLLSKPPLLQSVQPLNPLHSLANHLPQRGAPLRYRLAALLCILSLSGIATASIWISSVHDARSAGVTSRVYQAPLRL